MLIGLDHAQWDDGTGSLLVDLTPISGLRYRVSSWDTGLTLTVEGSGQWKKWDPDPDIAILSREYERLPSHPVHQLASSIPAAVRRDIAPYRWRQLEMLQLTARYPAARDLAASTPSLLWLLATRKWLFRRTDVEACLRRKRRLLLAELCPPARPGQLKLLQRVVLGSHSQMEQQTLRHALRSPAVLHFFRHWPLVPITSVRLALIFEERLDHRFMRSILEHSRQVDASGVRAALELVEDGTRIGQQLGIEDAGEILRLAKSIDHLTAIHDRWYRRATDEGRIVQLTRIHGERFPPAPIPGTDSIRPIETVTALLREGREMGHCVGTYAEEAFHGTCYLYRVLKPERCTLEVRMDRSGSVLGQLKAFRNQEPGAAVRDVVYRWYHQAVRAEAGRRRRAR